MHPFELMEDFPFYTTMCKWNEHKPIMGFMFSFNFLGLGLAFSRLLVGVHLIGFLC
jgi:hypothetical protein